MGADLAGAFLFMPTPAEQRVLEALDQKTGNVAAVATMLGLSNSFVNRIKKALWVQPDAALTPQPEQAPQPVDLLKQLVPPNIEGVTQLRDAAITQLQTLVPGATVREATALLEVLLKYEASLQRVLLPAVNVFQDNRTQTVTVTALVDKLAGLDADTLRGLANVPEPVCIEAEFKEATKLAKSNGT
jgi:hypothetical protein